METRLTAVLEGLRAWKIEAERFNRSAREGQLLTLKAIQTELKRSLEALPAGFSPQAVELISELHDQVQTILGVVARELRAPEKGNSP